MKLEVRHVHGTIRLDLTCTNVHELQQLQRFVELLNGKPLDKENVASNSIFDMVVRIESAGFDDKGRVESIAIEGPPRC